MKTTMKKALITTALCLGLAGASQAGNLAFAGTLDTTLTVAGADWFQTAPSGTLDINAGGNLVFTDAFYQTIIGQNGTGTFTVNLNTGGIMDFSGASGNGRGFWLGNNQTTQTGILNINGGTFDGSGINEFILGRASATGIININAGTMSVGTTFVFGTLRLGVNGTGYLNFGAGSTGALTVTGANQTYYEGLWTAGNLKFNGANTGAFADHFSVTGATLTLAGDSEPSPLALSGFIYDPDTNSFDVSLKGAASTAYILVEAADLDFSTPDQSPIPLAGATASVGSIVADTIVTDATTGNATIEGVSLGLPAKTRTFIRAQTP
jgi:hypothetical protein